MTTQSILVADMNPASENEARVVLTRIQLDAATDEDHAFSDDPRFGDSQ
jgi:hypothetical protein